MLYKIGNWMDPLGDTAHLLACSVMSACTTGKRA